MEQGVTTSKKKFSMISSLETTLSGAKSGVMCWADLGPKLDGLVALGTTYKRDRKSAIAFFEPATCVRTILMGNSKSFRSHRDNLTQSFWCLKAQSIG